MHEIAKHEFFTWATKLDPNELSEYETTLIAILIDYFGEIASVGMQHFTKHNLILSIV